MTDYCNTFVCLRCQHRIGEKDGIQVDKLDGQAIPVHYRVNCANCGQPHFTSDFVTFVHQLGFNLKNVSALRQR